MKTKIDGTIRGEIILDEDERFTIEGETYEGSPTYRMEVWRVGTVRIWTPGLRGGVSGVKLTGPRILKNGKRGDTNLKMEFPDSHPGIPRPVVAAVVEMRATMESLRAYIEEASR